MKQYERYPVLEDSTLLSFLVEQMKNRSRNTIKTLLANKKIAVDGVVTTQFDVSLKRGQVVTLDLIPVVKKSDLFLPFQIIYEDQELIAINKPSGLLSIATVKEKDHTAYHMIREYLKAQDPQAMVFVVHRLDRETSGVLIFAKSIEVKTMLQEKWDELVQHREYRAIVEGEFETPTGTIRSFLKENASRQVYETKEGDDAKEAITHYKVDKVKCGFSLLHVELETGRKNQIRVQMQSCGHPVVGDKKYGSTKDPIGRLGLHASFLSFKHPQSGELMEFKAPLPYLFSKLF